MASIRSEWFRVEGPWVLQEPPGYTAAMQRDGTALAQHGAAAQDTTYKRRVRRERVKRRFFEEVETDRKQEKQIMVGGRNEWDIRRFNEIQQVFSC